MLPYVHRVVLVELVGIVFSLGRCDAMRYYPGSPNPTLNLKYEYLDLFSIS